MKIGIFGDSFSNSAINNKHPGYLNYLSWSDIISTKFKNDVKNFGIAGSSLYYSHNEFLTHHEKFDKIIFMITDWGRIYNSKTKINRLKHVPGFAMAEYLKTLIENSNIKVNHDDPLILDSIINYYIYVQNNNEEILFHKLMIDNIKSIRSDVLLIPCFSSKFSMIDDYVMCMNDISMIDMNAAELSWSNVRFDPRHCHMNEENNYIFANKILDWINTNEFKFDTIDDFVVSKKPLSYYFNALL